MGKETKDLRYYITITHFVDLSHVFASANRVTMARRCGLLDAAANKKRVECNVCGLVMGRVGRSLQQEIKFIDLLWCTADVSTALIPSCCDLTSYAPKSSTHLSFWIVPGHREHPHDAGQPKGGGEGTKWFTLFYKMFFCVYDLYSPLMSHKLVHKYRTTSGFHHRSILQIITTVLPCSTIWYG